MGYSWIFRDNVLKAQEHTSLACRESSRVWQEVIEDEQGHSDFGIQTPEESAEKVEGEQAPGGR